MKTIGSVQPEYNERGEITNHFYIGGSIVILSEREARHLALLQVAWDDDVFRFPPGTFDVDERDMHKAFRAIRVFTEAKFAINEFRDTLALLNNLLIKEGEEGE
jgi:hypothetical protein